MVMLLAIPLLWVVSMVQSAIVSGVPLLLGTADIVLVTLLAWALQDRVKAVPTWSVIGGLFVSLYSSLSMGVYIGGYLGATIIAQLIKRRVWKVPFLGMLIVTVVGTLFVHALAWLSRWLTGIYIPIGQALNLVVLPSILLNLLISVPAYFVMRDIARWLYPKEIEA